MTAAAARLGEHDKRAAEAQQAEVAERARTAEAAEQAQQAEAAELARKAEAPVIRLLLAAPGGGGLCYYPLPYCAVSAPQCCALTLLRYHQAAHSSAPSSRGWVDPPRLWPRCSILCRPVAWACHPMCDQP